MNKLTWSLAALVLCSPAYAQTGGLLDTRKMHVEALQTFDLHTFAVGHGRLKSTWRADVFSGLDTSQNAVTIHQTVYGGAFFLQEPIKFFAWDSHWKLLLGPGGQFEYKARPHVGLYLGLAL